MSSKNVFTISFRGYRHMTEDEAVKLRQQKTFKEKLFNDVQQTPDVIREIFAPDPATGNPCSDFYLRAKSDSDVRDYIDKYMQSQLVDSPRTSDIDLALDSAKTRFESNDEYFKRLKELCNSAK